MKYNKQVSELITKLLDQSVKEPVSSGEGEEIDCLACNCKPGEHDKYVYCGIINGYLCRVCCNYDLYNNYELVNKLLGEEVFTSDEEVRMLCDKYCPVFWE